MPDGIGEFKPHGKSFPLGHLAQHVARLPGWASATMDLTELDLAPVNGPAMPGYSFEKTATLLEEFDRNVQAGKAAIARGADEDFNVPWTLRRAGTVLLQMPRYNIMRSMVLNHIIHHRAQLQVYLRLNNVAVPGVYGPSADDKGL